MILYMNSYWLIRCPACHKFVFTEKTGSWKLCPSCGEVMSLSKIPVYLETSRPEEAEELIAAVESYQQKTGIKELTPEEVKQIRDKYQEWLKIREIQNTPSYAEEQIRVGYRTATRDARSSDR